MKICDKNKCRKLSACNRPLTLFGLFGLAVTLLLNGFACYYLGEESAVMFSAAWKNTWLTSYLIFTVFLFSGAIKSLVSKLTTTRPETQ